MKREDLRNIAGLIVFSTLLISLFYVMRFRFGPSSPSYDEYFSIALADAIKEGTYSFSAEDFAYPSAIFLSFFTDYGTAMKLIPFIFSIINVCLMYFLARKIINKDDNLLFFLISFIISPVFIYTYTTYNDLIFSMFFFLAGSLLLMNDQYLLSMLPFIASFATNPIVFIIIISALLVFYERFRSRKLLLPIVILGVSGYIFISTNNIGQISGISLYRLITDYFSDFGASFGLGIFQFIMGSIGLLLSWKNKRDNAMLYFAAAVIFICSLYQKQLILFLDMILIYYGAQAFSKLWNSTWQSSILKSYVILLIVCGLIFSYGSYIKKFSLEGPSDSEVMSLEWLGKNNQRNESVFSYYKYGFMIRALSKSEPYADKQYYISSNNKIKLELSEEMFYSRNLKNITAFFEKNNLRYVWINQDMVGGEVWKKDDEGILFVMKNSDVFVKVYDYDGVVIWKYLN